MSEIDQKHIRSIRRVIHQRLIESLEFEGNGILANHAEIRDFVAMMLDEIEQEKRTTINPATRRQIEQQILEELGGYGPLAELMVDPEISDILVNAADDIWVDRRGQLSQVDVRFDDDAHLRRILDRLVSNQGRHLDASSPMVDAQLPDGSRLHAVVPPLCTSAAVVSIRKFRVDTLTQEQLIENQFLTQEMLDFLRQQVVERANIIIAGGASAGKTTMLNMVSRFIPHNQRIVTIEETSELRLEHPHVITLEGRAANPEGFGEIDLRQLVKTALRMRADRIIVGEVRGSEVLDMLQAMNIGHDGSLTTVHANTAEDVIRRLETLAMLSNHNIPRAAIRDLIGTAINLIVHLTRFADGTRRVTSINQVLWDAGEITVQPLFQFNSTATSSHDNSLEPSVGEFISLRSSSEDATQTGFEQ